MRKFLKSIFAVDRKGAYYDYICRKYFGIWMNKYIIPELDYQQNNYMFRKFYSDGTIAGFIAKGTIGASDYPQGLPVFCPWAGNTINLYDYPIQVSLINTRGVPFIPATLQTVDKDVVIGWVQANRKPVKEIVNYYAERLDLIEQVIKTNLNSHRVPWLLVTTPEDEKAVEELFEKIMSGDSALYVPSDFAEKLKILTSGNQFIIDKLYDYKKAIEDELRESLGCDNLGVKNKKEHLITDEIASNDEITEESGDIFFDEMQAFCERFTETFGFKIHIEKRNKDEKDEAIDEEEEYEDSDGETV